MSLPFRAGLAGASPRHPNVLRWQAIELRFRCCSDCAVVQHRDDRWVGTTITLGPSSGGDDGYRRDFRLERDLEHPIEIDATDLGRCHPMFLVRLRLFIDWHLALGHEVVVKAPVDRGVAQHLADMRIAEGLPDAVFGGLPDVSDEDSILLGLNRLASFHDVEDAAARAVEVLGRRIPALGTWAEAAHMAVSELCDNAILHGENEMGAYVAADRVDEPQPAFRLAIADLGIGIPEHIRWQHPEWQDDGAAISRVLVRGVTGTGDPMRGNGYAEVLDQALGAQLRRAMSALTLDIRSAKGHVRVGLVDEAVLVEPVPVTRPRAGHVDHIQGGLGRVVTPVVSRPYRAISSLFRCHQANLRSGAWLPGSC
jgi:hypothetical protein